MVDKELFVTPSHSVAFLKENGLRIEAELSELKRKRENYQEYYPYIGTIHLPYSASELPGHAINIAALDDAIRQQSIQILMNAIDAAAPFHSKDMVVHTCGLESIQQEMVGCYERMIDGFRTLADFAAQRKVNLSIENMVLRQPSVRHLYGSCAAEWLRIYEDVDKPNVRLTLDTSHAASSVAIYLTLEERVRHLYDFLAHPDWIAHIHWSDARINNREAYFADMHLIPGDGDLPRDFHQALARLDAVTTLEQGCSDEDALRGIQFIRTLL